MVPLLCSLKTQDVGIIVQYTSADLNDHLVIKSCQLGVVSLLFLVDVKAGGDSVTCFM